MHSTLCISLKVGEELERMHPSLYTNVTRQITRPSSSDLQSADTAPAILSAVSRDLFRSDITWGKVFFTRIFNNFKQIRAIFKNVRFNLNI